MDVTPHELRDVEITDAFRGYNRDEVNELLERAAATIESQAEQIRVLTQRIDSATADVGRSRDNDDLLQRTLVLAQRVADEAVAEAQQQANTTLAEANVQARATVADAESRSQAMIAEATAEVRRVNEVERVRIEREITQLATHREMLVADAAALERWESEYRERLVAQLESDLRIVTTRESAAPGPRPALAEVPMPSPFTTGPLPTVAPEAASAPAVPAAPAVADATGPIPAVPPRPAASSDDTMGFAAVAPAAAPLPFVTPTPEASSAPVAPLATPEPIEALVADESAAAAPSATDAPSYLDQVLGAPPADIDVRAAETERAALDDDEFFATLRDAVRDDAPLGTGDADADRDAGLRDMFKRRR